MGLKSKLLLSSERSALISVTPSTCWASHNICLPSKILITSRNVPFQKKEELRVGGRGAGGVLAGEEGETVWGKQKKKRGTE